EGFHAKYCRNSRFSLCYVPCSTAAIVPVLCLFHVVKIGLIPSAYQYSRILVLLPTFGGCRPACHIGYPPASASSSLVISLYSE
ncbi:hypothetical protein BpHYR1_025661, partial [Brachionus plicatilis]